MLSRTGSPHEWDSLLLLSGLRNRILLVNPDRKSNWTSYGTWQIMQFAAILVSEYLISSNLKIFCEKRASIMNSGWFSNLFFECAFLLAGQSAADYQPQILKTSKCTFNMILLLIISSKTNADGLIDVGQCVGSCRKAHAESYHVSFDNHPRKFEKTF